MNYILTKHETVRRTEKIQYEIEVPENIINKERYARNKIQENNYKSCKIIDIIDSELIEDEIVDFKTKLIKNTHI
jgi:hypothetical protein